jgi:hypothetical protein
MTGTLTLLVTDLNNMRLDLYLHTPAHLATGLSEARPYLHLCIQSNCISFHIYKTTNIIYLSGHTSDEIAATVKPSGPARNYNCSDRAYLYARASPSYCTHIMTKPLWTSQQRGKRHTAWGRAQEVPSCQ